MRVTPAGDDEAGGLVSSSKKGAAAGTKYIHIRPIRDRLALYCLLTAPADGAVVFPKRYFSASNELVVLTLVVCWIMTMIFDRRKAIDHPARNYVGHFNPCFGWDYPPASYVAVFALAADVYLAWTYATLEGLRTKLRDADGKYDMAERFSLVTTYLHGIASMLWMLLWQVGPTDNNWIAHLALFSTAVFFRYLCTLGNYVEQAFGANRPQGGVQRKHTIHIIVYGVVTTTLPILYFADVIIYKAQGREGVDPPIPWYVLEIADLTWVACLATAASFSIPEPPILIHRRVVKFGEQVEADEIAERALRRMGYTESAAGEC